MPDGPDVRPRKSEKLHNGRFYWLTRDVCPGFGPLMPAGPDFRYTNFSGGRGFRILRTQNYRVAVTVAFFLHKLVGLPSPSHLHFTHTNVSVAGVTYTLSGRFLSKIETNAFKFENVSALRAPFFFSNP